VVACAALAVFAGGCRYDAEAGREAAVEPRTSKVLLIGIDGVRPDVLAEVATPELDGLVADGFIVIDARTTTPSVSGPAWSSMLTGVWPEKHGVMDNEFVGKRYDLFPDFLTRAERTRSEFGTAAIVDWLPLIRADDGATAVGSEVDVRHALDGYEHGWDVADSISAVRAAETLRDPDLDALFVYLGNPDETSHEHGSIGAEYRTAISLADRHVGVVLGALRGRPSYATEDWLVLVSTDHGRRADGGHGGDSPEEMTTFVIASGAGALGATPPDSVFIVDVAATALAHLGVDLDPAWALDGRPLTTR
jgi:predicted AlkP superfamily pyrophosphatase or phosphodiesterase